MLVSSKSLSLECPCCRYERPNSRQIGEAAKMSIVRLALGCVVTELTKFSSQRLRDVKALVITNAPVNTRVALWFEMCRGWTLLGHLHPAFLLALGKGYRRLVFVRAVESAT